MATVATPFDVAQRKRTLLQTKLCKSLPSCEEVVLTGAKPILTREAAALIHSQQPLSGYPSRATSTGVTLYLPGPGHPKPSNNAISAWILARLPETIRSATKGVSAVANRRDSDILKVEILIHDDYLVGRPVSAAFFHLCHTFAASLPHLSVQPAPDPAQAAPAAFRNQTDLSPEYQAAITAFHGLPFVGILFSDIPAGAQTHANLRLIAQPPAHGVDPLAIKAVSKDPLLMEVLVQRATGFTAAVGAEAARDDPHGGWSRSAGVEIERVLFSYLPKTGHSLSHNEAKLKVILVSQPASAAALTFWQGIDLALPPAVAGAPALQLCMHLETPTVIHAPPPARHTPASAHQHTSPGPQRISVELALSWPHTTVATKTAIAYRLPAEAIPGTDFSISKQLLLAAVQHELKTGFGITVTSEMVLGRGIEEKVQQIPTRAGDQHAQRFVLQLVGDLDDLASVARGNPTLSGGATEAEILLSLVPHDEAKRSRMSWAKGMQPTRNLEKGPTRTRIVQTAALPNHGVELAKGLRARATAAPGARAPRGAQLLADSDSDVDAAEEEAMRQSLAATRKRQRTGPHAAPPTAAGNGVSAPRWRSAPKTGPVAAPTANPGAGLPPNSQPHGARPNANAGGVAETAHGASANPSRADDTVDSSTGSIGAATAAGASAAAADSSMAGEGDAGGVNFFPEAGPAGPLGVDGYQSGGMEEDE